MPPAEASLLSVLIIGGANATGRALLRCLRRRYRDIIVFVLDSTPIDFVLYSSDVFCEFEFFPCNLQDSSEVAKVVLDLRPEVIIHCAEFSEEKGSGTSSPHSSLQPGLDMTRNALSAAKEAGVKAFVYLDCSVDEKPPLLDSNEKSTSPAISSIEHLVLSALSTSFRATVVRSAPMIDSSTTGIMAQSLKQPTSPSTVSLSNSNQLLDFSSVDNVALVLILVAESLVKTASEANGQILYPIGWPCGPFSLMGVVPR